MPTPIRPLVHGQPHPATPPKTWRAAARSFTGSETDVGRASVFGWLEEFRAMAFGDPSDGSINWKGTPAYSFGSQSRNATELLLGRSGSSVGSKKRVSVRAV